MLYDVVAAPPLFYLLQPPPPLPLVEDEWSSVPMRRLFKQCNTTDLNIHIAFNPAVNSWIKLLNWDNLQMMELCHCSYVIVCLSDK